MKIGLVLVALSVNFWLGWWMVGPMRGRVIGLDHFSVWASGGLALLWAPFYWWCWRRFQAAFWPILLFPNPFVGWCAVLMFACLSGGGCL